jgi:glutamate dehydrogenase
VNLRDTPEKKSKLRVALDEEANRFEVLYLWLEESMPQLFFKEVSAEWISLIAHTLIGFKVQDYFSEIHLKNAAISLCLDSPEADVKILESYPNYGIKNYTTYISKVLLPFSEIHAHLRIAIIHFTVAEETIEEPLPEEQVESLLEFLIARNPSLTQDEGRGLIRRMDVRFLRKLSKEKQITALELFHLAQTRDHCQYEARYEEDWEANESASMHIILAWKNTPKHNFLYRLARLVNRHELMMRRVSATYVDPYTTHSILMLSFGLHGSNGNAAWEAADIADFLQEVVTLKYFGSLDLIDSTFVSPKLISGNMGNLLRAMINFIHQVLVNVDPHQYSLENIEEGLCRHPELTMKLCTAFEYKFNPFQWDLILFEKHQHEFNELVSQLDTGQEYHDARRKNILFQGMNFIEHTLKTNFYLSNKTAFSFRLDPAYLDKTPFERKKIFPELPFGIFFIKGMHFIGFHIRFKDLARGGLRTIYPEKRERMLAERNTVFSECYNLAYTQHKKNKDIPEGGAKGIIFLKPYERLNSEAEILTQELMNSGLKEAIIHENIEKFKQEQKIEYLYQTQRSFIKNFLSLINCNDEGRLRAKDVIDYWKKPEYIYLGPDENMHNVMIEWIAEESKKERYKPGGAFISGKPRIGINHKEYGVTSLGVNVYMHEILKFLGIVKITGGPDGDVAGNQILNFLKYYPNTAKILALTDISGTIFDPHGLNLEECVRLFYEGKPIRFYRPDKLSSGGFLLDRDTKRETSRYISQTLSWQNRGGKITEEWLSGNESNALFRNNVHQTKTDIFLPCGGRPRTLRDTNYKDFLDMRGEPTSKAIIEGANLYLSTWARRFLEEKGVIIVKDSSANKAGVICSSFEILCGLSLKDEEFLENKEKLVGEILEKLKILALDEAHLLLITHQETKEVLSEISEEISKRINLYKDQLLEYLEPIQISKDVNDPFIQAFLSYCPKTLYEKFSKRLLSEIPENHKKAIIASHIAAKLVYTRGLKWVPRVVDILPIILKDKKIFPEIIIA